LVLSSPTLMMHGHTNLKHAAGNATADPDYLQSRGDDLANSYFKIFTCSNERMFLSVRQWSENTISPSIHDMNSLHRKELGIKWRFKIVFRTRIFRTFRL
jgi:hypothetical protein